ncbi:MAG: NAD(P)H-binding protein [Oscillospiraceae bacterium]|nr:NAD(P)H-binding protein [Oscillospiraceae bacterium]
MSKVLVITGATGRKSGGAFAEQLSAHFDTVSEQFPDGIRAVVRQSSDTNRLEQLISGVSVFRGSLEDPAFLRTALNDADTLVHVAGIHWSREIVTAAAACGVRRIILVHTTGIYSKYKQAGEEYRHIDSFVYSACREHHILLTILRPTMIYGNTSDQNIVQFIKMVDKLPIMPVINGARYDLQPVHYQDLGKAYYDVLMHEEETAGRDFILSGLAPIQLRQMFEIIGEKLGKKVHFVSCPFWIAYLGAWAVFLLSFKRIDYREKVQRLCESRAFPHQEASAAFSYAPRSFEAGIAEEIEEYQRQKKR